MTVFVLLFVNKVVNDLKNKISQIPIGTNTSNMINNIPLIKKNI